MGARIKAAIIALGILAAMLSGGHAAEAKVPYSWICHKSGKADVQVWTPGGVGYWVAYRGYYCNGGFWRWV